MAIRKINIKMKVWRIKLVRSVAIKTARYQSHETQVSLPTCGREKIKPTV